MTVDKRSVKRQKVKPNVYIAVSLILMACLQVYHEGHSLKEKKEGEKTKTEDANWLAILEDYEKQKYFHKYRLKKKIRRK